MADTPNPVARSIDHDQLAFALAHDAVGAKEGYAAVIARHGVAPQQLHTLLQSTAFCTKVETYRRELQESGASFRLKAAIQAEELLKTQWRIIHDPDTPPATAVKAIENVVRWAELEPKKTGPEDDIGSRRPQVVVNIDLSGGAPVVTIPAMPDPTPSLPAPPNGA